MGKFTRSQLYRNKELWGTRLPQSIEYMTLDLGVVGLSPMLGTSLQSFVSDAAVFPGPLLLKDCGFDPFRASVGGSHRATAECQLHPGTPADRRAHV